MVTTEWAVDSPTTHVWFNIVCVRVCAVGGYIRPPDLQEVIDYLNYPDDSVKANAAAYLQHLSYNDDGIKAKTR